MSGVLASVVIHTNGDLGFGAMDLAATWFRHWFAGIGYEGGVACHPSGPRSKGLIGGSDREVLNAKSPRREAAKRTPEGWNDRQ